MHTYTNQGTSDLYIDGRRHAPGTTFTTEHRLPNEASLIDAGCLLTVEERTALVELDAAGLGHDDIVALAAAKAKPRPAKRAAQPEEARD